MLTKANKGVRMNYTATEEITRHKEDSLLYCSHSLDKGRGGAFMVLYNATPEIYGGVEHIES